MSTVDLNKVFFTSDLHLDHGNIIDYQGRPFKNKDHMNHSIIDKWNEVVSPHDTVYILGDVALASEGKTYHLIHKLNGNLYLVRGNHDKSVLKKQYNRDRFEQIDGALSIKLKDPNVLPKGQLIYLHHYSCRVWEKSHEGSWHLYGHSHSEIEDFPWGKSMDVGVDNAYKLFGEFRPFTFFEIKNILDKRKIKNVGHH